MRVTLYANYNAGNLANATRKTQLTLYYELNVLIEK